MIKTVKTSYGLDGFHMTFANGNTVSVQVGKNNYAKDGTAEVAAWQADGEWIELRCNDPAIGWQSADEVLAIMNRIANM